MAPLWRWLWLADVQSCPLRFKYRLVGSEHVRRLGRDYTGHWIDEAHPASLDSVPYQQLVAAAKAAEVGYGKGDSLIAIPDGDGMVEELVLPLARDGQAVDMLLAISIYHSRHAL
jgi:hypothetical protein